MTGDPDPVVAHRESEAAQMDRDTEDADRRPEIVAAVDYETGVIPLARPGVVVWLEDDAPDRDEVDRAAAMRAHPAGSTHPDEELEGDEDPHPHLRAVS